MTWTPYASAIIPSLSQEERSTWCAGTRTRPRRRELTSSRRQEIKYRLTHPSKHYFLKTVTRLVILNLFIAGNICPHPGPVRDQEGLGVRRGLQEKVQGPQCAGGLFFLCCRHLSEYCLNFTAALLLFK